ncbi:hypothetical protein SEA_VERSE_1 [Streptomyces phage Verse]|uniref:Uncharacterized protein n=2 Tax=Streptomyces phage Amela TaxID=1673877 RepID=A0A0K1Y9I1_9CAUD|nr:hypothetical protein AVT29_gp01 [Streptomyces phage Amela]AKY03756.2 hypothetical protein SEA_AMELA_1 [Streptomyces phage Amela]AKY03831.1 hypothetical protein SEA_VERSE_1 [Streptomyces phage Verse]
MTSPPRTSCSTWSGSLTGTRYDAGMEETSAQETGIRFAEIMLGVELEDREPTPGTPFAAVRAFCEKWGEDALTPSHWDDARAGRPLLPRSRR